jgi:uncharacterized protein YbcC (UPF0753/DUF2309 family)
MSVLKQLDAVKDTIPHYWPIGSFIHHNPLKGFEHLPFKEGLKAAQAVFGGKVYMDSGYFMERYREGKIDDDIFERNIRELLEKCKLDIPLGLAKTFLMEVSPQWNVLRTKYAYKNEKIDYGLYLHLEQRTHYRNEAKWLEDLVRHMTLYEINDALFGQSDKERVERRVIEFVTRFLDEEQTTMQMPNRERGMFETFKLYAGVEEKDDAETFVEKALQRLKVRDSHAYLLTHLLKLHGWAGFIKYRSQDPDYYAQQQYPTTLIDYMAIRFYYELEALSGCKISDFDAFEKYVAAQPSDAILQMLKHKNKLMGPALDALEAGEKTETILCNYIENEIHLDALQIQHSEEVLRSGLPHIELADILHKLKAEEGYLWLKSLEDSYIRNLADEIIQGDTNTESTTADASATFCLDVRSEVVRRHIERRGNYTTYGAGGFLGLPVAFVEFDKAHELFLAPAIVKPHNVVFEIPVESSDEYRSKKKVTKTTKKVLSDLKNNPYTPFITVEAIGWLFGINLFGKTFLPQKTQRLFSKFKPQKPKTTYTIDKLSDEKIENYVKKLHAKIISKLLHSATGASFTDSQIENVWRHLLFGEPLGVDLPDALPDKLKTTYQITPEDYAYQKEKLGQVGFTLEEKVHYLYNYLTMIGQTETFPEFVTIIGHGSVSDNNPFESALDCGACGGNISLPNARALCMIANQRDVREALQKEKGIAIPETTVFIPGLHITTTDEIRFYDTDSLDDDAAKRFTRIKEDFNAASAQASLERAQALPYTETHDDIVTKSMDWSEPRPEWGLAKNMGAFAGPRSSVAHMKLDNRLFLHSYDWRIDNDNADILTRIFDGPLIVGEWINLEHYFSTVDNHIYGAGSKVYHNVVGKVGVFNGNYSDLKIGLPTQSVELEGKAYHEPVRLLTFMEAPLQKVLMAVENSIAKPFILNEWIRPVVIDREAGKIYSFEHGEFIVIKEI